MPCLELFIIPLSREKDNGTTAVTRLTRYNVGQLASWLATLNYPQVRVYAFAVTVAFALAFVFTPACRPNYALPIANYLFTVHSSEKESARIHSSGGRVVFCRITVKM